MAMLAVSWGCSAGRTASAPPPVPAAPIAEGLRVTLSWSEPVDLDLYVTDPSQETAYFARDRSVSGGVLRGDVACGDLARKEPGAAALEQAEWATPPAGRYRVGVDFSDDCGSTLGEAQYRLVMEVAGRRDERVGTVRRTIFEPVALEFDVPGE
jgi:uncharacterized protein YfaP (DUF2135 family)